MRMPGGQLVDAAGPQEGWIAEPAGRAAWHLDDSHVEALWREDP
jgi:hypothetical protein